MKRTDGVVTCARYAFAPNFYHYCGPDTAGNFKEYVSASEADGKLVEYLANFETLYPYLQSIAAANTLADPLDYRVVEAYWVGNSLLSAVTPSQTYVSLTEGQKLDKRVDKKTQKWLFGKIDKQARLHHSFHVFNVFTRTGHRMVAHTCETMDSCRISWGQVTDEKQLLVKTQQLVYRDGKLVFIPAIKSLVNPVDGLQLVKGDWVSFHWGFICEKISLPQVSWLKKLTEHHLALANETL